MGGCIATDRITVDGLKVGSMLRELPTQEEDSGWVFFAGDEPQEYLDDADNLAVYEVNTIANYDPAIIPYLYALPGQRFDRDPETHEFVEAPDSEPDASAAQLPAGVDVVQGSVAIAKDWSIAIRTPFRRRREHGYLVLWRPALTLWIGVDENDAGSPSACLDQIKVDIPAHATEVHTEELAGFLRLTFRLHETSSDAKVAALHAFTIGTGSLVHMRAYFDREIDADAARSLSASVRGTSSLILH
jgi:hypothetical protein